MSNLSGIGDNKTYRGSLPPREPYYYIRANLDLSGQSANDKVYYFNRDNSFAYTDARKFAYPNPDSYPGYYMIEDNAVIGEVAVYSNPDIQTSDINTVALGTQIVNVSRTSGVATLTLNSSAASFGLETGDYVTVSGISNNSGGFNTSDPVQISVSGSTISYDNGSGSYSSEVKATGAQLVSVARLSAGVATLTLSATASSLGLSTGDFVTITGITNDGGSYNAASVQITASGNTISYANGTGTLASQAVTGTGTIVLKVGGSARSIQAELYFQVGGAYRPSSALTSLDVWGGPTGNVPGSVLFSALGNGQVCYYGAEPADPSPNVLWGDRKFLAVKIRGGSSSAKMAYGNLFVVLKVYPKFR